MKRYTITVNGTAYDVTVDDAGNAPAAVSAAAPAAPAAAPAAEEAKSAAPSASGSEGAVKVDAPMPGTILDIKVSVGDSVNAGDVLCILEAMKMENEIVAPQAGAVSSVNVSKGDSVEAGQVILTMN
ncbi:MAG: biotin/lipoyl-binding protein [Clostridiales bacterium]|nr:biotin/lipoyl-binding protein [Clostridiales bacterium]